MKGPARKVLGVAILVATLAGSAVAVYRLKSQGLILTKKQQAQATLDRVNRGEIPKTQLFKDAIASMLKGKT